MEPIFVKVGACVMLEDKTVVRCVEDVEPSCVMCVFRVANYYQDSCMEYICAPNVVKERKTHVHFEQVNDACDRCGREVIEGDAICEGCKIEEMSNLF